ncbi:diguanylate cyclase domain-containing protein [Paenibacillus abyssi]|uniref:Diguanylate cyclase n=1 Tax=Paenibacillus abyssi TaxID=1340531 RepID=A0A917CN16_9BACL|nr:diguanylate cyclase [Paenibacillus abyssi]GGF92662.1 diguanylate cyclase [Paenibacillus abyssi]
MSIHLRTYYAVTSALLIIILTTFLSFNISNQATAKVESEIGNSHAALAYQMADKLDHYMWSRSGELKVLSKLEILRDPHDPADIQNLLEQLKTSFPAFSWIGLTNADGIVEAGTGTILEGFDISERPVFKEAQYSTFIGDVHDAVLLAKLLPNPSGETLKFVDIGTPIHNADGAFIGVLAAHLSWEWSQGIRDSIIKPLKIKNRNQIEIFIISAEDNRVLLGPHHMIGASLNLNSISEAREKKNGWEIEQWPDGLQYLTGYAYGKGYADYPGLGWTVLVREPTATAFSSSVELRQYILCLGIVSSLIFAFLGWLLAGKIAKPLHQFAITADRLRNGEKVEVPYFKGIKDIEVLSTSLRDLLATLIKTETRLGRMEDLAHHDKLTGLSNRTALDHFLMDITQRAEQHNETFVFLYFDLDGFKSVNDTLGHHAGDLLLKEAALRLQTRLCEGESIFRLGGDEFILVLSASTAEPTDEANAISERIIETINQPFYIDETKIRISCSIGGAVWPDDATDPVRVIRLADSALYISKNNGKNRVTFYHDTK